MVQAEAYATAGFAAARSIVADSGLVGKAQEIAIDYQCKSYERRTEP